MFQLLRGVALIAMMLNCGAAFAEADQSSANYVMRGCRDFISSGLSSAQRSPISQGFCVGAVMGIAFASQGLCIPSNVTSGQEVRVVVKYIDDRPARLHESFMLLAFEALRAAWPCKN
jgi:hypothetical protein